jgi:Uma2 family endonuclease
MYDLPSEYPEDPGLPDQFHIWQPRLLEDTFRPPTYPADQVFVATDLNLYYDITHSLWYKRPDWFAAVGNSRLYEGKDLRLSYVVWQERVNPFVVVELLSPGTEKEDLGQTLRTVDQPPTKWQVYEQILRIPYYVVFDRYTDTLRAFVLQADRYTEINLDQPRIWMPTLELGLGLWDGSYKEMERLWLRWYDKTGNWISTPEEQEIKEREKVGQVEQQLNEERQRAEQAEQQLNEERQRAERLAAKLRKLNIDPNEL